MMGALCFLAMGAMAESIVPINIWSKPDPSRMLEFVDTYDPLTITEENPIYLYNADAHRFFVGANDYQTRASLGERGAKVWFKRSTEPNMLAYLAIWNFVPRSDVNGNRNVFTDDGGNTWVDRNQQNHYSWTVSKVYDFYRLQNARFVNTDPTTGKFLGWKGDDNDMRLYLLDSYDGYCDWYFATPASYQKYEGELDRYEAGEALRKALIDAEECGIDINESLEVYKNKESTLEQLIAAKEAVEKSIPVGVNIVSYVQRVANAVYNLNGQRVNGLQRGINIVDGQKIMVK